MAWFLTLPAPDAAAPVLALPARPHAESLERADGFEALSINLVPSLLVIGYSAVHFRRHRALPDFASKSRWFKAELMSAAALVCVDFALLFFWYNLSAELRPWTCLVSAFLAAVASACAAMLLGQGRRDHMEPIRALEPYFLAGFLFDTVKSISLVYLPASEFRPVTTLTICSSMLKLAIATFEQFYSVRYQVESVGLSRYGTKDRPFRFWAHSFCLWAGCVTGIDLYALGTIDVLQKVDPDLALKDASERFDVAWHEQRSSRHRLAKAAFLSLTRPILSVIAPMMIEVILKLCWPIVLSKVLCRLLRGHGSDREYRDLCIATTFIFVGIPIAMGCRQFRIRKVTTALRGLLVYKICEKMLTVSSFQTSQVEALMTTDMESLAVALYYAYMVFRDGILIGIATLFLTMILGKSTFLVLLPLGVFSCISHYLTKRTETSHEAIKPFTESRSAAASYVVSNLKALKITGLISVARQYLTQKYDSEQKFWHKRNFWLSASISSYPLTFAWPVLLAMGPSLMNATPNDSTVIKYFAALALLEMILIPLISLSRLVVKFRQDVECADRIQSYLALPKHCDQRRGITETAIFGEDELDLYHWDSKKFAVELFDANVSADANSAPVLRELNIRVPRGQVTLLVGPPKSGKSLFVHSVLGETHIGSGTLCVDKESIDLCDESSLIRNTTLRYSIVGTNPFNSYRYRQVITACLLDADFDRMPRKDNSLAGKDGANLSIDQKARLRIARTIYSRPSTAIFDNIFAHVTPEKAQIIFRNLFSFEGLLQQQGTTVLLVADDMDYVHTTEHILIFDGKGSVVKKNMAGALKDPTVKRLQRPGSIGSTAQQDLKSEVDPDDDAIRGQEEGKRREAETSVCPVPPKYGDLSLYDYYLSSLSWFDIASCIIGVVLVSVLELAPYLCVALWASEILSGKTYIILLASLTIMATVANGALCFIVLLKLCPKASKVIHSSLLDTVLSARLDFLVERNVQPTLKRLHKDTQSLFAQLPIHLLRFIYLNGLLLHFMGLLWMKTWTLAVLPCIYFLIYRLGPLRPGSFQRFNDRKESDDAAISKAVLGAEAAIVHIRRLGWQGKILADCRRYLNANEAPYDHLADGSAREPAFFLAYAPFLLGFVASCMRSCSNAYLAGILLIVIFELPEATAAWSSQLSNTETAMRSLESIRDFQQQIPIEVETDTVELSPDWPSTGRMTLKDVTARYYDGDKPATQRPAVINGISFVAVAGEKTGIAGLRKRGKTTAVLTILGFLEQGGLLEIDGIDIRRVSRPELRSRFVTIPGQLLELPGSIRANLVPEVLLLQENDERIQAHDALLKDILSLFDLWDHICSVGGLDSPMEENKMTSVQKQLFNFARGAAKQRLNQSKMVILDNATASFDEEQDGRIQSHMAEFYHGVTKIVTSGHMLQLHDADYMVELSESNIIAKVERKNFFRFS